MPPPTVTNGTSTTGIPASASIWSVHTSVATRESVRSPGCAGVGACWGAMVLSLTAGMSVLRGGAATVGGHRRAVNGFLHGPGPPAPDRTGTPSDAAPD